MQDAMQDDTCRVVGIEGYRLVSDDKGRTQQQYKIRWSEGSPSWQPKENIEAPKAVLRYWHEWERTARRDMASALTSIDTAAAKRRALEAERDRKISAMRASAPDPDWVDELAQECWQTYQTRLDAVDNRKAEDAGRYELAYARLHGEEGDVCRAEREYWHAVRNSQRLASRAHSTYRSLGYQAMKPDAEVQYPINNLSLFLINVPDREFTKRACRDFFDRAMEARFYRLVTAGNNPAEWFVPIEREPEQPHPAVQAQVKEEQE
jgi:hypothetical protein